MADSIVVVKGKAKARKNKKADKKAGKKAKSWSLWNIVGITTTALAVTAGLAYYLLSGEETAVPSKTRKASDAI
jgi:hypothetical protein